MQVCSGSVWWCALMKIIMSECHASTNDLIHHRACRFHEQHVLSRTTSKRTVLAALRFFQTFGQSGASLSAGAEIAGSGAVWPACSPCLVRFARFTQPVTRLHKAVRIQSFPWLVKNLFRIVKAVVCCQRSCTDSRLTKTERVGRERVTGVACACVCFAVWREHKALFEFTWQVYMVSRGGITEVRGRALSLSLLSRLCLPSHSYVLDDHTFFFLLTPCMRPAIRREPKKKCGLMVCIPSPPPPFRQLKTSDR